MQPAIEQEMIALLPRLRRFATTLTRSVEDADDLVQATCERAIRNLDKWQPGTRLDSWLYRIAQNLQRNTYRDGTTRQRYYQEFAMQQNTTTDGQATVGHRRALRAAAQIIDNLPAEQRAVLLLVAVEGHSYKETSLILDLPVTTITNRLARARETLRQATAEPTT